MLRDETYLSCKAVFDCTKKGDDLSLQILDFVGEQLGNACAMISAVFDPEVYVIGGGVSKAGELLIDLIRDHYKKYAFHASVNTEFVLATLGNDAGMYGAVKMVL
jgi:glucokinase